MNWIIVVIVVCCLLLFYCLALVHIPTCIAFVTFIDEGSEILLYEELIF